MVMETLEEILEKVWEQPSMTSVDNIPKKAKTKKTTLLGEFAVEPTNPITFENGIFFVEKRDQSLVIKPKTKKRYIRKVRNDKRTIEITKGRNEILIPLQGVNENPIAWFELNYLNQIKRRNTQSRLIKEVWKYRDQVFKEVLVG